MKKALSQRFKPEQIARLGNLHVIYPSFSRATYQQLIARLAGRYTEDIARNAGVQLAIGQDVLEEIYQNAVFPAQGTRPLFSQHGYRAEQRGHRSAFERAAGAYPRPADGVALAPALEADEPLILEPFAERLARFAQQGQEKTLEMKGETFLKNPLHVSRIDKTV